MSLKETAKRSQSRNQLYTTLIFETDILTKIHFYWNMTIKNILS